MFNDFSPVLLLLTQVRQVGSQNKQVPYPVYCKPLDVRHSRYPVKMQNDHFALKMLRFLRCKEINFVF